MTIDQVLTRAVDQVLPKKEGLKKLMQRKKIRLYLGIDPTTTQLHLGHTVMLRKLQQFADLGHQAILLFGTGTVLVGDPSLRETARQTISQKQIDQNISTWKKQVEPLIDFNKIKIKHNGDWLLKLTLKDIIKIASKISAAQLFKRDSFQKRLKKGDPVWYHETIYPLLQGYDSVVMDVDLEIGGTDQTFNMLIGRELQQKMNQKEKFVLAGKMIPGTDGKPMSKTSGNCIWLTDSSQDMFGKLMKIQDQLMPDYFEFFTDKPMDEINQLKKDLKSEKANPMETKKKLAFDITSQFHGKTKAQAAQKHFQQVFQDRGLPPKIPTFSLKQLPRTINLIDLLEKTKLVSSRSEAKRLVKQGGVKLNQKKIKKLDGKITINPNDTLQVGKRKFIKFT
jgi:tyrosyl-tRNA synthetase